MKTTFRSGLGLILLFITSLIISGCGGGSKEPGGSGSTAVNADNAVNISSAMFTSSLPSETALLSGSPKIGTGECANCHKSVSSAVVSAWLNGPHGNNESWNEAAHSKENLWPANTGFPFYGYKGFGSDPGCSTACHDPLGEGQSGNSITIANYYASTGDNTVGTVNRPVIGCEACHGGGQNHLGVSAVPVSMPNALRCGRCHNSQFSAQTDHNKFHPEGNAIFEDWSSSAHARSINSPNHVAGSTTDVRARCSRCHTDEGARSKISIVNGTESYNDLITKLDGSSDVIDASVDQCRTCHDGHNPKDLLGNKATYTPGSAAATTWSEQFRTCTSCHQLLKEDNTLNAEAYHNPTVNTKGNLNEIITDTHYDDPTTPQIEGYVINPAATHSAKSGNTNSGACPDCHNPHNADNTINRQWARSAHAGFIMAADGTTSVVTANPFVADDFKLSAQQRCQRCHTATGFRNLANNPTTYDADGDGNPDSPNVFVATGNQRELIYCWACHTSNTGVLRGLDRFVKPTEADYNFPAGRSFPDGLAGSFICLNCHSGRRTGQAVKALDFATQISGKSLPTPHHLLGGGVLYRTIGFEFDGLTPGQDYSSAPLFAHDTIGVSKPGTGTNGPCVGCHMRSSESHLLDPVKKDTHELITNTCSSLECHTGITADQISAVSAKYQAALSALEIMLNTKGIVWVNSGLRQKADPTKGFTAWTDKNTAGAAFNFYLLKNDPGAYAHNDVYAKKLIYDSIDWLDDGVFNRSVETTLGSGPAYDYLRGTRQ